MPKSAEEIAKATGVSITTARFVINGQAAKIPHPQQKPPKIDAYISAHKA